MSDQDDRAPGQRATDDAVDRGGGRGGEVGGRLVQQQERGVSQERPGQGKLLALPGRQLGRALGSDSMNGAAPASRAAFSMAAREAPGRPRAMLSATDPPNSRGCCGIQAIWARHGSTGTSARSVPPTQTVPEVSSVNRSSTRSSVVFPAPLGPVSTISSPGLMARLSRSRAGRSRPA